MIIAVIFQKGDQLQGKGHWGLTLFILSLIVFPLEINRYVIALIFLTAFLSSLPDIDLKLGLAHRTFTHTLLFAILAGILFSILFGFIIKDVTWYIIGFLAGFGGVVLHLIGDLMTHMSFKPLYPFSSKEVAFGWFRSDNMIANFGFFLIGWIVFFMYLLHNSAILRSLL